MSTPSFWKGVFVSSGWAIFGQPLYVYNVAIAGKGTYNVIYVTTENDSVYTFDADGVNTMALWHDSFINPSKGITPIPGKDTGAKVCPFASIIGITGTPVIDPRQRDCLPGRGKERERQ
jgi:hypothetical protein